MAEKSEVAAFLKQHGKDIGEMGFGVLDDKALQHILQETMTIYTEMNQVTPLLQSIWAKQAALEIRISALLKEYFK